MGHVWEKASQARGPPDLTWLLPLRIAKREDVPLRLASICVFERNHRVFFLVLLGDQFDDLLDTLDVRGASKFFAKNRVCLQGVRQNHEGADLELDEVNDVLKDGHEGLASKLIQLTTFLRDAHRGEGLFQFSPSSLEAIDLRLFASRSARDLQDVGPRLPIRVGLLCFLHTRDALVGPVPRRVFGVRRVHNLPRLHFRLFFCIWACIALLHPRARLHASQQLIQSLDTS
jgi:hypothetical protein